MKKTEYNKSATLIKVILHDGDHFTTWIRLSPEEATHYYLHKNWDMSNGEDEHFKRCTQVEIMLTLPDIPHYDTLITELDKYITNYNPGQCRLVILTENDFIRKEPARSPSGLISNIEIPRLKEIGLPTQYIQGNNYKQLWGYNQKTGYYTIQSIFHLPYNDPTESIRVNKSTDFLHAQSKFIKQWQEENSHKNYPLKEHNSKFLKDFQAFLNTIQEPYDLKEEDILSALLGN